MSKFLNSEISGLVLAGGESRRMKGKDKGLVFFKNNPLIFYSIEILKNKVSNLLISANRNLELYKNFGYPVITDLSNKRLGPLGGIQAGLTKCTRKFLIVVSCDTPFLPKNLVETLYKNIESNNYDIAMPYTLDSKNEKRTHPTTILLRSELLQSLNDFLNNGGRKIDFWTSSHKVIEVYFDNEKNFANLNSMKDLSIYE